ncbi:hypothetical protein N9L47_03690 [Rhodobacteraceae bacterium]|nr:hypothetical protein [Paracoccaceae bacterium]
MMTRSLLSAIALLFLLGTPLHAACFADYKASRDNPLKLHYGVMKIDTNPCTMSNDVQRNMAQRLGAAGWKLLQVQSVFDDSGLGQRKTDAGQYFLRF